MAKVFCPKCNKEREYFIKENIIKNYKGYEVNVKENIAFCKTCNEDIYIEELESENFKRLYNKYRKLANIIEPKDIIDFRRKFNISQRELTSILNWGKMTINRYERGSVPSQSNNDILKLIIENEEIFKEKVEQAFLDNRISKKTYEKINSELNSMEKNQFKQVIISSLTHAEDEYNGFRKFDPERLENLISYLSDKVDLYKTSLNKYLWYIDFISFRENTRSVTGLRYMRYSYGPIVENFRYEDIINYFNEKFYKEETILVKDSILGKGSIVRLKSYKNYDMSIFDSEEIKVIDAVINQFKSLSCNEISDLSHKEEAWKDNKNKQLISYEYGDKIKLKV